MRRYIAVVRAAPALGRDRSRTDVYCRTYALRHSLWDGFVVVTQAALQQVGDKVAHTASLTLAAFLYALKNHPRQRDRHPLGGDTLVLVCVHEIDLRP